MPLLLSKQARDREVTLAKERKICLSISIYIYIRYITIHIYIYIYTQAGSSRESERERERDRYIYIYIYIYTHTHIYIYTHTHRGRQAGGFPTSPQAGRGGHPSDLGPVLPQQSQRQHSSIVSRQEDALRAEHDTELGDLQPQAAGLESQNPYKGLLMPGLKALFRHIPLKRLQIQDA